MSNTIMISQSPAKQHHKKMLCKQEHKKKNKKITFEISTTWQAFACTWFFYKDLKPSLTRFILWKKIHVHKVGPKLIFLRFGDMISRHQKIRKLWFYFFLIIFQTNLPYHIDRIFLNQYLNSNTTLKMQSDFRCIFLPKMDQSLRRKSQERLKIFKKYFNHLPTFIV